MGEGSLTQDGCALAPHIYHELFRVLPKNFWVDLESVMAKFWWGQNKEEKKIHLTSWRKFCLMKCLGGVGFKILEHLIIALLMKHGWHIL